MTHSPLPWKLTDSGRIEDKNGLLVAEVTHMADDNLFLAAPDIYAALKLILDQGHNPTTMIAAARAIAKVEG